ncbi:MAG: iron-sulfur cluster assembly scaffold protein [Pseudomonadota bacterium]
MADDTLIALYSEQLLGLAANSPLTTPLPNPDGVAKERSPLCGSVVSVEIALDGDRIAGFHQDVKACALGQASAAVFARHAVGLTQTEVATLRDQMSAMLKHDGDAPSGKFEDLRFLLAARGFKNRHDSILLVFNATLAAFDQAQKKASA